MYKKLSLQKNIAFLWGFDYAKNDFDRGNNLTIEILKRNTYVFFDIKRRDKKMLQKIFTYLAYAFSLAIMLYLLFVIGGYFYPSLLFYVLLVLGVCIKHAKCGTAY